MSARQIRAYLDQAEPTLGGWAGFDGESTNPEGGSIALSLMLGSTRLGGIKRTVVRPDCDAACGYVGAPKGFVVEASAAAHFAAMAGLDCRVEIEGGGADRIDLPVHGIGVPSSMAGFADGRLGVQLADIWLTSSRQLAMRFDGLRDLAQARFSAYQLRRDAPSCAVSLPVRRHGTAKLWTAEVDLINGFAPVLFVLADGDGDIIGCEMLAFPSLARGGLHAIEVRLAAPGFEGIMQLTEVAGRLTRALHDRRRLGVTDNMCQAILFDATNLTGTETMFDTDLIDFVERGVGIPILLETGEQEPEPPLIRRFREGLALSDDVRRRAMLRLPGNAFPTLTGLLEPLISDPTLSSDTRPVPFIVADGTGLDAWLVSPNAPDRGLPALIENATDADRHVAAWPMAILKPAQMTAMRHSGHFPIALDAPERDHILSAGLPGPLSVLVSACSDGGAPLALLQSVRDQADFGVGEIIYAASDEIAAAAAQPILEDLFPGRYRIALQPHRRGHVSYALDALDAASHDDVVVLSPDTILHDPLTLMVLTQERLRTAATTMSCPLVRTRGNATHFASAGFYLNSVSYRGLPTLLFDLPDTRRLLVGTHMIIAAPLAAMSLNRNACLSVRSPASSPRRTSEEISFGLRILQSGGSNGMTMSVTASTSRDDLVETGIAGMFPLAHGSDILRRLISVATGLQRL